MASNKTDDEVTDADLQIEELSLDKEDKPQFRAGNITRIHN